MTTDTVLVIILLLLSANLFLVGVYLVLVLKDFRSTLQRVNRILDTMTVVTNAVADPVVGFSEMASGLVEGIQSLKSLGFLKKFIPSAKGEEISYGEEVYDE